MAEFSYGERLLGQFGGREHERVTVLASVMDPATFSVLESIGVAPGWRCLDAGAGAGSVGRWLAGRVAPATVVAVDRDIRFLGDPAEPNLVVRELDLVTGELPAAAFDLVFARIVLLHLRTRETALERLCRAVAPGGNLARSFLMTLDALSSTAMERGLIDQDTISRATALLTDPRFADLAMTLIHTWGRQPTGAVPRQRPDHQQA